MCPPSETGAHTDAPLRQIFQPESPSKDLPSFNVLIFTAQL